MTLSHQSSLKERLSAIIVGVKWQSHKVKPTERRKISYYHSSLHYNSQGMACDVTERGIQQSAMKAEVVELGGRARPIEFMCKATPSSHMKQCAWTTHLSMWDNIDCVCGGNGHNTSVPRLAPTHKPV